jgi:LCP family protein required for cell wall assembly
VTIYREGIPVRSEKLASALLVGGLEKGAPTLVETITNNFDIPIHNFAIVDFFGFETLIDELNGVPLWFPYPVRDAASGLLVLEAGCTTLDGRDSLAFVRSRKLEAFIDGNWNRVGVWNDLERNQRQQDFLIRTIQRAIGKGARSVIVQDDLIRAGAEAVVLDDRLSIAELLKLGRAFSDFNPSDLARTLLPVVDAVVGTSAVLELGEGANSSFAIFRGEALIPNDISIRIIDSRSKNKNTDEITEEIIRRGFKVDIQQGETTEETVIEFSLENYEAAVLLGRFIEPIPKFELIDDSSKNLTLVLGEDFEALPLMPKTFEQIDSRARPSLPVSEKLLGSNENALGVANLIKPLLPVRQGATSPMKLVKEIDGQPPSGQKCG